HLAIGLVEGLATAVVVDFVARARPEVLQVAPAPSGAHGLRPLLIGLGVAALLLGGVASWFASTHPDGLEWSIARVTGQDELAAPEVGVHERLSVLQESTAILPDYGFKIDQSASDDAGAWPSVSTGTSVSGLAGGVMTLGLALLAGFLLRLHALRNTGTKGA
ncbi:MAG: PDGLE domain-containing protein, partial [Kiritimatiellae bacterium]|nr:PDGLE domain-containing protein [Kiritimatiellia bacterium]